jgi:hypothetical protein
VSEVSIASRHLSVIRLPNTAAPAVARGRRVKHPGSALSAIVASFTPCIIYTFHYLCYAVRTAVWIADFLLSGTISSLLPSV